jgi:glutamate/aspartate transport system substrate-binding protein
MPNIKYSKFFKSIAVPVVMLVFTTKLFAQTQNSITLYRINKTGVIKVGYIPTPGTFAFQDQQGQTMGYSIDICHKVIENIRKTLRRPDLRVSYMPLKGSQRIPMLKAGEIDIECGGNTNTIARQKEVDFSHTFFTTGARLLTQKTFQIERASDLWKKRVAVSKGTTAETLVNQLKADQDLEVVTVSTDPEGVELVEKGKVDAFAQDDILLYGLIGSSKLKERLVVTGRFMSVEPYAFMLPKDDTAFKDIVDKTMLSLMSSGELLLVYKKWFDTDQLRIPMNSYMKENIRFPNKYGIP